MQRLEISGAVRPLQWPLGVKGLRCTVKITLRLTYMVSKMSDIFICLVRKKLCAEQIKINVGSFYPFYRPRKSLGRVEI
jgi:hypothetical protein